MANVIPEKELSDKIATIMEEGGLEISKSWEGGKKLLIKGSKGSEGKPHCYAISQTLITEIQHPPSISYRVILDGENGYVVSVNGTSLKSAPAGLTSVASGVEEMLIGKGLVPDKRLTQITIYEPKT